ncbi:MAG TPA: VIT domain-containing protein [Chthonomonadaceae bacterium]|nr:VIT domain-containing protein [Chthonomonadaceae bacterium]
MLRKSHFFAMRLISLWGLCGLGSAVHAQGILYPVGDIRSQPFYVKNLRVNTRIDDAVAETTVEQTFVNTSAFPQEGTYLYPLPEGASPTAFSMTVGDQTLEPRVLSSDEARGIYEEIVRRRRDPALLEYVGRNLVRVRVFPIPAHGERTIRLRYTEVLKTEGSLRRYAYPLSTSRFGAQPVGVMSIAIRLQTSAPLKNLYSPTHALSIRRLDDRSATASWEGREGESDKDLTLYFSTSDGDVGLSLLTYKSGDRDGYFMLLAAPRVTIPRERILPKHIVFVLDRTGSMAGPKIEQARKALLYCLNSLHPQDRFDVITFNESPDLLLRQLAPATEANIARARRFVADIDASGGTNIEDALHAALNLLRAEPGREKMVVFLTDGLPTVGETDIDTILRHVQAWNGDSHTAEQAAFQDGGRPRGPGIDGWNEKAPANARLFCFGLGYDVNVPFLDRLADLGRGDADYVKPEEDIEVKVSAFFAKVSSPILSDLQLAFDGTDVYDVYPKVLPDLFKGTQLVITGRFRGEGGGTVRLAGFANGTEEKFQMGTGFGAAEGRNAFLPRIWAARKIGYLVDQLRLSGNPEGKQEVIDEIVRLSKEYGIITEYTSFLVDEREQEQLGLHLQVNGDFDNSSIVRQEVARRATQYGISGQDVTDQSLRAKSYAQASQTAPRYQSAGGGMGGRAGFFGGPPNAMGRVSINRRLGGPPVQLEQVPGEATVTVQDVGDKTFYRQKDNVWEDNAYDPKKQSLVKIKAFSDAHFALLKALPKLAAYSSVGDDVIISLGKTAVEIGKEGKDKLTDAELKGLTGK